MSWLFLLSTSVVLYSLTLLLQKILLRGKNNDPIAFSILFQLGVALVIFIFVLIFKGGIIIPNLSSIFWSIATLTLTYALGNVFIFRSLKETQASKFTIIFSSKTLFAVLGVSLFFKESLSILQWIGALFIISGVIIVSVKKVKDKLNKGDMLALMAALMFGLANINDRFLTRYLDPYAYVVLGFLFPGLAIAAMYPRKTVLIKEYLKKEYISKVFIVCFMYGIAALLFFASLKSAPNSSQVFSINSFSAILTVFLSIIFLKEKENLLKKIIGVVISVIGLILVNR